MKKHIVIIKNNSEKKVGDTNEQKLKKSNFNNYSIDECKLYNMLCKYI